MISTSPTSAPVDAITILPQQRSRNRSALLLAAIIGFSTILAVGLVMTRRPWCDEGWFASPALNLMHHGFMGMTVLDPHGFPFATNVKGIDRYTYWIMPGYFLIQTVWYKILGFHLFTMRAISVFWGVVALVSYYIMLKWLLKSRSTALLATALLGTEQTFSMSASTARMDMMTAAMGLLGIAAYIKLRTVKMDLAFGVAGLVLAAALFTHPNALFAIITLGIIILRFDAREISLKRLAIALTPVVIFSLMWGVYALQGPGDYASQMHAQNSTPHRLQFPLHLLNEIKFELSERYGFYKSHIDSWVRIDGMVLVSYLVSIILVAAVPSIRKRPGVQLLLLLTLIHFALLLCFQKNWYYLIFILPYYTALLAVAVSWLWQLGTAARITCVGWLVLVTALNLGVTGVRIAHNDYQGRFRKATAYILEHRKPGDLTIGSGDLAFDLGFEGQVLDDPRLGYYTGKAAEFVVVDAHYYFFWFPLFYVREHKVFEHLHWLLAEKYDLVYDQTNDKYNTWGGFSDHPYQVFRLKHPAPGN